MPPMKFSTPERVCWNDDTTDCTFFVVVQPVHTKQWRSKPDTNLDEVLQSHTVFSFKRNTQEMAHEAYDDDLQKAFSTTDIDTVIKSILAAGKVLVKEFELEVETPANTAANAAVNAAAVATESITSYVSSFWGGWGSSK